jgi:argonaute-like protein implicated in RNA metabolism and viral defense
LRGSAYIESVKKGYLWTTGFVPRLKTNPYQGFPQPLSIEITRGEKEIKTVLEDIFALTKLNYNSCTYGDGEPITLKFAEKIGEILTAGPIEKDKAPLSFKYYI